MEQTTAGAIPKKPQDQFVKNVLLLKNCDFRRIDGQVFMPTWSEISTIKKSAQLGQFERKVEFFASMPEDMVKKKLEKTFPYLKGKRFSCAAVVKLDKYSSRFEFHGPPRPWNGKTIKSKIKGNSALYILEDEEPNLENGTSTNIHQGDDDDDDDMSCIATDVTQLSLLDSSQMEIDDSQQLTPGEGNNNVHQDQLREPNLENGTSTNIHQGDDDDDDDDDMSCIATDVTQMSDSSEEGSSSADTSTTSGISGSDRNCTEGELALVRWLQKNFNFEVEIRPNKSPPQGGDPFVLTFNPKLHPAVTSGLATFGNVDPVELEKSKKTGSLFGSSIPASSVLGWVPVAVESQDGIRLGQTEIYYGDQEEDFLQQIVVNPSLQKRLFDKYNRYQNLGGNLETSGVEAQNYETLGFKQPVQMLSLLVYAAAEIGALQFIELIFTSSAGRVVFDVYKNNSTLPEVIAKDHGNEQTANYLRDVNKRFSEDIRNGEECSQAIDWSELAKAAEAAQKQHEITGHKENYQIEKNVCKETGYLGDVDTSSNESSEQQSSDSEDDISSKGIMVPDDVGSELIDVKTELIGVKVQVEDVGLDVKDVKTEVTDVKTQVEDVGSDVKDVKTGVTDVQKQVEDVGSEEKDICPPSGSDEEIKCVIMENELLEMTSFSDLSEAVKQQDSKDLKELQVKTRKVISKAKDTVASHRVAADKLDEVWKGCKTTRATGSIAGVVGTCLAIGGTVMSCGTALPLIGMGIGVAAATTTVGSSIVEAYVNSSEMQKAEKDRKETLDSVNEVNDTVQKWLVEKEKRRLLYICHLADLTLKCSDPAVIEILQKVVLPTLTSSATKVELAILGALGWVAAQAVTTAVVKGGVKAGVQAAAEGAMEGIGQAGLQAAGKLMFTVAAVFVVWELIDLSYTINDIVKNKGSGAAQFLRLKADEIEKSPILAG